MQPCCAASCFTGWRRAGKSACRMSLDIRANTYATEEGWALLTRSTGAPLLERA
jgi:hypothetical protein